MQKECKSGLGCKFPLKSKCASLNFEILASGPISPSPTEKQWKPTKNYEKPWNYCEKPKSTKNHEQPWDYLERPWNNLGQQLKPNKNYEKP